MALEANIDLKVERYANAVKFNVIFDAHNGTTCSSKLDELKLICRNVKPGTTFPIVDHAAIGVSGSENGYVTCICMETPKDNYTCEYAGGGLYYTIKRLAGVAKCY